MTTSKPDRVAQVFAISLTAMTLLAGCASVSKTPEVAVTERAQERLDLYVAGDIAQAYEYLSPGYRSGISLAEYQRKSISQPFNWTGASVSKSDCTESACKLRISVDIVVYGALPGANKFETKSVVNENWIKTGGQWYFVPSN